MSDLRRAVPEDAAVLAGFRLGLMKMVKDGGIEGEEALRRELEAWYARGLRSGKLLAWLACEGDKPVSTATLRIDQARRGGRGIRDGYVMDVQTLHQWRRRGLAESVLCRLIEEAHALGLRRLMLHPMDEGKGLYEKLGFVAFRRVMILRLATHE